MNAKEYLEQYRLLDLEIQAKLQQISHLRNLAKQVTFPTAKEKTPGCPSQTGNNAIRQILDLEQEIQQEIEALCDTRKRIRSSIQSIDEHNYRLVLELRYLNQNTWETLAEELGIPRQWAHELHKRALQKIILS